MADDINLNDVNTAITELRAEVEKKSVDQGKVDKINDFLDKYEESNQETTKKFLEAEKASKEIKDELEAEKAAREDLEVAIAKGAAQGKSKDEIVAEAKSAVVKYGLVASDKHGNLSNLEDNVVKTLRTDVNTGAGFLVMPPTLDSELRKEIVELDPMRTVARVRAISGKTLEIARRVSIPVATYEGEAEAGGDSQSSYEAESVTPYALTTTIAATRDQMMDSGFDMQSEILSDAALSFAFTSGNAFVLGDGVKKPTGFLSDTRVTDSFSTSSTSGVIDGDDILNVQGTLKTGYNPVFLFNRRTLAALRTLKGTSNDHYLWDPALNGPATSQLAGTPYVLMNSMPDIAANAFSVAFGDFNRGYEIFDRTGTEMVFDEVTQKRKRIIEWTLFQYNTGQVIIPEAITGIKVKA